MVVVVSKMALSTGAGVTSADQITGTYQFVPKGILKIYALGSATGLTMTVLNNGMSLMNAQAIPFFGTTGTLKKFDNQVFEQAVNPGRIELYFQNPTGGALTADFIVEHIATK
jgi:hypothetical protein